MFVSGPLGPAVLLMGHVTTMPPLRGQFPARGIQGLAGGPVRALPALRGCLALNGIRKNCKGSPSLPHPQLLCLLLHPHTTRNLVALGWNGLRLAWDAM